MKNEDKYELIRKAFVIIKKEELPKPTEIKIRSTTGGTKKRRGSCTKNFTTGDFKIIINSTDAKFIPDENGKFIDKKGNKFKKATMGVEATDDVITKRLAHEIAHLRFWNHNAEHVGYTEDIYKKFYDNE